MTFQVLPAFGSDHYPVLGVLCPAHEVPYLVDSSSLKIEPSLSNARAGKPAPQIRLSVQAGSRSQGQRDSCCLDLTSPASEVVNHLEPEAKVEPERWLIIGFHIEHADGESLSVKPI